MHIDVANDSYLPCLSYIKVGRFGLIMHPHHRGNYFKNSEPKSFAFMQDRQKIEACIGQDVVKTVKQ